MIKKAFDMRRKPDLLFLLSVLVVTGVVLSNFIITDHSKQHASQMSLLNVDYGQHKLEYPTKMHIERDIELAKIRLHPLKTHQIVRID